MGGGAPRTADGRRLTAASLTVLGIGNPLAGDDGAGLALAAALGDDAVPRGVRVRSAEGDPLALLEELEDGRDVLLLDACRFGGRPGEATWLRLDDPTWPERAAPLSLHGLDLPAVFQLARAMHLPLDRAWLMGVEPGGALEGHGLSPALTEAFPHLVDGARQGLRCLLDGRAPTDPAPAARAGGVAANRGAEG